MIPLKVPHLLTVHVQDVQRLSEHLRLQHNETNLWRYGKVTLSVTGTSIAGEAIIEVQAAIPEADYILNSMSMSVSPTEDMPDGLVVCNARTTEGNLFFDILNTKTTAVTWSAGSHTFLYHGVYVGSASEVTVAVAIDP